MRRECSTRPFRPTARPRSRKLDPADVTAVILTRDEERNLPRALTSLPRGMRVFVLDACSRDHTVQFAKGAGAEVVQREWTDFVDARRFALSNVRTPWAFMLDADEALDDRLLESLLSADGRVDAYRVARTTYFCGKPMRVWRDEPLIRLFRPGAVRLVTHPAAGGTANLHERWESDGSTADLAGTLLHYSYPDYATYRKKFDAYTSAEAGGLQRSFSGWVTAALQLPFRFARLAFVRGGILDGPRGWYVSYKSAAYTTVVAWKALAR
jgi:glycosyltransferase involved in cell wall biosynthesis